MRVAHLLRKYNPAEWGGTETALQRLFEGLRPLGVAPIIFCPRGNGASATNRTGKNGDMVVPDAVERWPTTRDPLAESGYAIKTFRACVPILGISREQRRQMIAVGGNLMSFDLIYSLWREPGLDVIHSHALGRIGSIGLALAKRRGLPFVVTIHGGALDLPPGLKVRFYQAPRLSWEWGKIFGALLRSRQLLEKADAVLTCNPREAALLQEKYPGHRIQVQPHGVDTALFEEDCRHEARAAFPQIGEQKVLLAAGRIDSVKNQLWLVERLPAILMKHPKALLVLAGACTDEEFGKLLQQRIQRLGVAERVLLTGGLRPSDPSLLGLFQSAEVLLLPSISETFGLVLLEAWAAGKPVISSRTSGASALVRDGENGWLFDLSDPQPFHMALDKILLKPELAEGLGAAGRDLARSQYDIPVLAERVKNLYGELMHEKNALRNLARR